MKIHRITKHPSDEHYGWAFFCPGCNDAHVLPDKMNNGSPGWVFDGDEERPTFSPSVLTHPHDFLDSDGTKKQTPRCHLFVRAGRIEYLGDSTHALAGQTIEIPEFRW